MPIPSGVFEPEYFEQMQIFHQAEMSSHHAKSVYIPFNYTIHESNPWITSFFWEGTPVQYLTFTINCSLILGIAMKSAILLENLTTLAKKCQHPPTSNSRRAVPSIKSRIYKTETRKPEVAQLYLLVGPWICKSVAAGNIMAIWTNLSVQRILHRLFQHNFASGASMMRRRKALTDIKGTLS